MTSRTIHHDFSRGVMRCTECFKEARANGEAGRPSDRDTETVEDGQTVWCDDCGNIIGG